MSVGATWLLVPSYGIIGAAWAKVVAYLISAIMLYIFAQRVYPMKYEWGKVMSLIGLAALTYWIGTTSAVANVQPSARIILTISYALAVLALLGKGLRNILPMQRR